MTNARTYLFTDHTIIAQAFAMRRRVEPPRPLQDEPVLWNAQAYGSVLRDPKTGLFRMWYLGQRYYHEYFAASSDGVHWELPNLGVYPPDELGRANAFLGKHQSDAQGNWLVGGNGPEGFSVLDAEIEDHPAAKERFTALYLASKDDQVSGLCIAHSPDGIHWIAEPSNPVIRSWMDTSACLIWDPDIRRYVVYGRPPVRVSVVREANRYVMRSESADLVHWDVPRTTLTTDDADADPWDQIDEGALAGKAERVVRGPNRQWYGLSAFKTAGMYIGFARMFDVPSGAGWIELIHSSDGIGWHREPLREPFIAPRPGSWEDPLLLTTVTSPPIRLDDDLLIYHGGMNAPHHGACDLDKRGIGCRVAKADRWVGYHSATEEAELLTHPVAFKSRLRINARTGQNGWIRVGLVTDWGEEIEGYELSDAVPITGDSVRHDVRWTNTDRLPARESLRVRVRSQNASIWALETGD